MSGRLVAQLHASDYFGHKDPLSRILRAATYKYHLQLCKIEKSKIPKLCHNKGFRYLITEI